jgi:predicted nucleotidyltransferase component of viral defense system
MTPNLIHKRPQEFLAALEFTSAKTGFSSRLIEKDYWCSLALETLFSTATPLVFKGGTLLSKAYAEFERLSEDLDFTIPTPPGTNRSERSQRAREIEAALERFRLAFGLTWEEPWTGHNSSTQHIGRLGYPSVLGGSGAILVEVGQREALLKAAVPVSLKTLLLDPLFSEPILTPIKVAGLSKEEAYAEKVRAALTRREPAIRDIFDLWQAFERRLVSLNSSEWIEMIRRKCAPYDLSESCAAKRKEAFERAISTDLIPVLRSSGAEVFDFNAAWALLLEVCQKVIEKPN